MKSSLSSSNMNIYNDLRPNQRYLFHYKQLNEPIKSDEIVFRRNFTPMNIYTFAHLPDGSAWNRCLCTIYCDECDVGVFVESMMEINNKDVY